MKIPNNQFNCGVLVVAALLFNIVFLYINYGNKEYLAGILHAHGEVGFNVYKNNSVKISPERLNAVNELQSQQELLVNYDQIDHIQFGHPTVYRNIFDTVGYGVLLGALWKITNSLHYFDVQILQIIIFSLLMILIYLSALMLWGNSTIAFNCGIAHLLFLPLVFQNVQANRDIWAYYGVLICLYATLRCIYENASWKELFFWFSLAGIAQFIRFISFFVPLLLAILSAYKLLYQEKRYRSFLNLFSTLYFATFLWSILPTIFYNKQAHNVWWVFPSGFFTIESLGEYDNPWGYQLNDEWYAAFMKEHYNLEAGTIASENIAKDLAKKHFKENPGIFIRNWLRRFKDFLLPNLPWSFYPENIYGISASLLQKFKKAFFSPSLFLDLISRLFFVRLYLLAAYLGFLFLLLQKRYFEFFLLSGLVAASWGVIFAHMEYRYLVPFYCFSSLSVGYLFSSFPLYSSYFFKRTAKS